jgi:PKD repeat protein
LFYAAVRCRGKVYPRGTEVPYRLALTVTRAVVVEGIAFAQRIAATYDNPGRLDSTPCQLGLSRDAARYSGTTSLPSPPVASFTETIDPASASASFSDQSVSGRAGAALVSEAWQFGDPGSGSANAATGPNPTHTFSAPGTYTVSLTVTDANGLSSTSAQQVTIPASYSRS